MIGRLINRNGGGRYLKPESAERVIRYITRERENETRKGELVSWGARGLSEYKGIDGILEEYKETQSMYKRRGNFGRYITHKIYCPSEQEIYDVHKSGASWDTIARKMAGEYYNAGYQTVYGVHCKDENTDRIHVHLGINTVNFRTANKLHESLDEMKRKEVRNRQIIQSECRKCYKKVK